MSKRNTMHEDSYADVSNKIGSLQSDIKSVSTKLDRIIGEVDKLNDLILNPDTKFITRTRLGEKLEPIQKQVSELYNDKSFGNKTFFSSIIAATVGVIATIVTTFITRAS